MGVCGRIRRVGVLATLALLAGPQIAPSQAAPAKTETLRAVAQGSAVRLSALRRDTRYRDTFLREFDSLTPENELKMAALQPHRGRFSFTTADELVDFARRHGRAVHGHALVWGLSLPLWLIDHGATDQLGLRLPPIVLPILPGALGEGLTNTATLLTGWRRDELLAIMTTHIRTVMRHFAGRVGEYGAAARACNAVAACKRFTTWGFTDRLSWLGVGEAPLLFDSAYQAKPALAAVRSAFAPRGQKPAAVRQSRRWRWRAGTGARCGWGSCSGLRAGRG